MKGINKYQKLVLLLYGITFIYFSILHVPFKTKRSNEIVYDSLFSDKANLDFGRLALITVIISLLALVLFLLTQNIKLQFKIKFTPKIKTVLFFLLGAIIISLSVFYLLKYNNTSNLSKAKESSDSTAILKADTTNQFGILPSLRTKYLYNGKTFELADIQDAAKQSNLDVGSYIKKAGMVVIDEEGFPIPKNTFNPKTKTVKMIFPDGSMGDIKIEDTLTAINKANAWRY